MIQLFWLSPNRWSYKWGQDIPSSQLSRFAPQHVVNSPYRSFWIAAIYLNERDTPSNAVREEVRHGASPMGRGC